MESYPSAQYREVFNLFDKDGDGKISCTDLGTLLRSVGRNPTEAEVRSIIEESGFGANGSFTCEDFIRILEKNVGEPITEEELLEAFRVFDKDGSGQISVAELRHLMTNIGEKLSNEEVDEMIREADVNSDGYVNYESLVRVMMAE